MANIDTAAMDNGAADAILNDPSEVNLGWLSSVTSVINATSRAAVDITGAIKGTPAPNGYDPATDDLTGYGPQIPLDVAESRGIVRTMAAGPARVPTLAAGIGGVSPGLLLLAGVIVVAYLLLK